MPNISSLCYNPTPQNGTTTEINFPIADAEVRKAIYTDSLRTYIGLPATPTISIDNSGNNNRLSFWPSGNNTQIPLVLQENDPPSISNDSTIKIINQENTDCIHYLVKNDYEEDLSDYICFWDDHYNSYWRQLSLGTSWKINGTNYSNYITLSVDEDGTRDVYVSDSAAWREAFEIKNLGLVESAPGNSKPVNSGQTTNLCSKWFDAGTWLIHCIANFPAGGTGARNVYLSTSENGTGDSIYSGAYERANSGTNIVDFTTIKQFTASALRYLNVYQNSGKVLNVHGGIKAVKICDFVP